MDLTARDVHEKQFHDAWRGYNQEEVDDFLDRIAEVLDRIQRENSALHNRLKELEQAVATSREAEEMLKKTLVTAQQAAEEAIAKAKAKAEQLVAEAERRARGANEEARRIIGAAEEEISRKTIEAERAAKARRRDLDAAINRLTTFESQLHHKLAAFIRDQEKALDELSRQRPVAGGRDEPDASAPDEDEAVALDSGNGHVYAAGSEDDDGGRVVHVDRAHAEEAEETPAAHRRGGVRGLFFREES